MERVQEDLTTVAQATEMGRKRLQRQHKGGTECLPRVGTADGRQEEKAATCLVETKEGAAIPDAASSSGLVDEQLARYRAMRDFSKTAEPSGQAKLGGHRPEALPFVIQKHAATRLHYDFRLGLAWRSEELGGDQRTELCARR